MTDSWRGLQADTTEDQADHLERAIVALRSCEGILAPEQSAEKQRVITISLFEIEVLNKRNLADRQRGHSIPRKEAHAAAL